MYFEVQNGASLSSFIGKYGDLVVTHKRQLLLIVCLVVDPCARAALLIFVLLTGCRARHAAHLHNYVPKNENNKRA